MHDDALLNSQRSMAQKRDSFAVNEAQKENPYRRKTYQHRNQRPTTATAEMLQNSTVTENLSQAESNRTLDNSRSIGADGKT